ncbi:MAG: hypothetical protein NZ853_09620 [Leptospiraceae bacterium]|nr:hypothetical protein [Leptospiraceae bacterium]MDW7976953.1 hypothetical protein [Leptospiraceae bacterium]
MKIKKIFAYIASLFFVFQSLYSENTVRIALDFNYKLNFQPELQKRLNHINNIKMIRENLIATTNQQIPTTGYFSFTSGWENFGGEAFTPIEIFYLRDVGVGKFYAGLRRESYNYEGRFSMLETYSFQINFAGINQSTNFTNIFPYSITGYSVANTDLEVGYEFKIIDPLKIGFGIGSRSKNRSIQWTTLQGLFTMLISTNEQLKNDVSGLYNHLNIEYLLIPNLGLFLDFKSGSMTGSANSNETNFSVFSVINVDPITTFDLVQSLGWKSQSEFTEFALGVNLYLTENSKIKLGFGQKSYTYSYLESTNEISLLQITSLGGLPINLENPSKWSKPFDEERSYFSVGFEGNFDF